MYAIVVIWRHSFPCPCSCCSPNSSFSYLLLWSPPILLLNVAISLLFYILILRDFNFRALTSPGPPQFSHNLMHSRIWCIVKISWTFQLILRSFHQRNSGHQHFVANTTLSSLPLLFHLTTFLILFRLLCKSRKSRSQVKSTSKISDLVGFSYLIWLVLYLLE